MLENPRLVVNRLYNKVTNPIPEVKGAIVGDLGGLWDPNKVILSDLVATT
jgi:hypothetical protein